ncbi:hypothetical protein SY83_11890 [Paenibacillus swuensis]|uniref:Xylose isomerase-like TIM barrel domain-containing protein n=1 Tax=Paenibacillus swuensis TaxID=1178515 RepID=A0A172TIM8_9BACL|nr:sugar phosphate isomerase/epimerase [Paenibacillus swuensis]ANE46860.1 hypothetical protein SY83_11890 [Paenibacillus swuensis]
MPKIPVGLQLYTLRDATGEDFIGTLKKIAAMGYEVVEFAGYGDVPAKEMASVLDGLGLKTSSAHIGLPFGEPEKIGDELKKHLEYNHELGTKYIISPFAPIEQFTQPEEFTNFYAQLQQIGEEVKKNGFQYGYHNHAFELEILRNGKPMLDELFASVSADNLIVELDLYWVQKAGLNPVEYLQQYKGRTPLVHVKDMTGDDRKYFAEVGHGIIDFSSIFNIAEEIGIEYYIVEQDSCERDPLESVKMSIDYLKSIGIA